MTTSPALSAVPMPPGAWRFAGACAIAHLVAILAGLVIAQPALFAEGTRGIQDDYVEANLTQSMAGGLLQAFGFLLLVPALVMLARVLGRSAAGRYAAQCGLGFGMAYVAVTFAVGFPAGAASLYGAQQGLDLEVAFALNNIRVFGFFLSMLLLGGSVLGIAVSALLDGRSRWIGGFGAVTGLALLTAPALAPMDLQDVPNLAWMVWWVGVGVILLRGPRSGSLSAERSAEAVSRSGSLVH